LICIALSPLQAVLNPPNPPYKGQERLKILFPDGKSSTNDKDSQDPLFVEFVTLRLVFVLMAKYFVSIVFVHGLASNPETTWEGRSSRKSWVHHFLPKENLNSRIMLFNHNTVWEANALGKSLSDHGNDLLDDLDRVRNTEEVKNNGQGCYNFESWSLFYTGEESIFSLHRSQLWGLDCQTGETSINNVIQALLTEKRLW